MKSKHSNDFITHLESLSSELETNETPLAKEFLKTIYAYIKLSEQFYKVIDITDKYQADVIGISHELRISKEELKKSKDIAEKANQAKSEFLANMSHEIRTPLNAVIGYTDLLKSTELNQEQRKFTDSIKSSAKSLLQIINDILDFSKIEAGMLELEVIKVNFIDFIDETLDNVKYYASTKGLELLVDFSDDFPEYFYCDSLRLKQVLINLINNAIKFTDKGFILLTLRFAKSESDDIGIFDFSVKDTGIGVSEKERERLFKSFSQADPSTTRKYGGTGLGLSISQTIIKKMESEISFDSQVGIGSTFRFSLKLKYDPFTISNTIKFKHILIIQENEDSSEILKNNLKKYCDSIDIAANAIKAVRILEECADFDLIFVDYSLQKANGLDVIKILSKNEKLNANISKMILLYNLVKHSEIYSSIIENEVAYYISKPVKIREFIKILHDIKNPSTKIKYLNTFHQDTNLLASDATILLVEDNHLNMNLLEELIKKIVPFANILLAYNGIEAFKLYKECKPNMILSDLQMPLMDGFKLCQKIREIDKDTILIAFTAMALQEEVQKCINTGFNECLNKPLDFNDLIHVIKKFV